ncbi:MAG: hypothetical protein R3231_02595 [bacterium]|nr:hypothetical protein [bacterium]
MILHPGIIALLTGSAAIVVMLLYSAGLAIRIIRSWDMKSSSEGQLALERKTYLVSTIMNYVFGFELLSSLLFVYTIDGLHPVFVGAMCATGSLNANPVGWYALYAKMAVFFLAGTWIVINLVDQKAYDFPLVRLKYILLLGILPVVLVETGLLFAYFMGLKPNIITSCCGALFSDSGGGLASGLSSLPIGPTMVTFYGTLGVFFAAGVASRVLDTAYLRYAFALVSLMVLIVSMASVVAFISLYFYEIPTHHCPFDIFQGNYRYVGYPLYGTLFLGTFLGMMTGVAEPLRRVPSLNAVIPVSQKRWTLLALLSLALFSGLATWPVIFSAFTLEGYF